MSVNRLAALKADTDVFTTFEGDNTVLMLLLARGLMTDDQKHFGELNPAEMVTFIAGQAVETVIERLFARKLVQVIGDAVGGGDDNQDLFDGEYQLELFRWREGHITASAAQRFKRGLDEGYDPFEVFRAVQDHAADAARAHMGTVVLEAIQAAVAGCEDETLRPTLKLLCDLYAMRELEADKGFFQEHGRLAGPRCKAITREVNRLCNQARMDAGALVDAFGIPDAVLGAPIGLHDPAPPAGVDAELDLRRLTELQELLGSELPEIVATLIDELTRAVAEVEAGIAAGDLAAAALAAHAARNSALMLDAKPMLDSLREIESGARAEDLDVARAGLARVRSAWPALRRRLEAEAQRPH
jgi:HPt (histidine-containing phosphotransfer) domain-containing protein